MGSVHREIIHIEEYPGPILQFLPAIELRTLLYVTPLARARGLKQASELTEEFAEEGDVWSLSGRNLCEII